MSGQTNRRRTSAARSPVGRQYLAGARARQIRPVREEAGGLLGRVVARVRRADDRRLVADGQRVDDAEPPTLLSRDRRPMEVESPSEPELRERQQLRGGTPRERRHGADLDKPGDADE